jgi:hypothetical protein
MIKFDIDIAGLTASLAAEEKRLAYAVATAMNRTALEIQREERAQLDRSFTIRKNEFMYRLVKITAFAKVFKSIGPQQPVFAEIALDNTKARVLLVEFVEGGYKEPASGKSVGVPITGSAARPAFTDPVSAAYQLSRIQLTQRVLKDGTTQLVSAQDGGIFSLPREAHGTIPRGLFQKVGDMVMALYLYVDRPKLKQSYDFFGVAIDTYAEVWDREFDQAYNSQRVHIGHG